MSSGLGSEAAAGVMDENVPGTKNALSDVRRAVALQLAVSAGLCVVMAGVGLFADLPIGVTGPILIALLSGAASLVALLPFAFLTRADQAFAAGVGSMMLRTALSVAILGLLWAGFGWDRNATAGCFLLCYLVLLVSEAAVTVMIVTRRDVSISQHTERMA